MTIFLFYLFGTLQLMIGVFSLVSLYAMGLQKFLVLDYAALVILFEGVGASIFRCWRCFAWPMHLGTFSWFVIFQLHFSLSYHFLS